MTASGRELPLPNDKSSQQQFVSNMKNYSAIAKLGRKLHDLPMPRTFLSMRDDETTAYVDCLGHELSTLSPHCATHCARTGERSIRRRGNGLIEHQDVTAKVEAAKASA
jgi:hypothetical protein